MMRSRLKAALPPIFAAITLICLWEAAIRLFQPRLRVSGSCGVGTFEYIRRPGSIALDFAFWCGVANVCRNTGLFRIRTRSLSGTALAPNNELRRGVYPLANLLQMVPVIALAPLLNIWFGHGIAGVSASAAIVAIFPMIANTVDGLRGGDPKLQELFTVYGASRWQRWRYLDFPGALPSIFTGMKIAVGLL